MKKSHKEILNKIENILSQTEAIKMFNVSRRTV